MADPTVTFKNGKRYWFPFQSLDALENVSGHFDTGDPLPTGLTRDPRTGDIHGVPNAAPGEYTVELYQDKFYTQVVQPA